MKLKLTSSIHCFQFEYYFANFLVTEQECYVDDDYDKTA